MINTPSLPSKERMHHEMIPSHDETNTIRNEAAENFRATNCRIGSPIGISSNHLSVMASNNRLTLTQSLLEQPSTDYSPNTLLTSEHEDNWEEGDFPENRGMSIRDRQQVS